MISSCPQGKRKPPGGKLPVQRGARPPGPDFGQRVVAGDEGHRTLQFFADQVEGNLLAAPLSAINDAATTFTQLFQDLDFANLIQIMMKLFLLII